jgi:hypothetical protein
MMPPAPPQSRSLSYTAATIKRAEQALLCSPFQLGLFSAMGQISVPLPSIAGREGQAQGYSDCLLSENRAEKELTWLIKVGLLRREVDGQGITDSFRLTPLGRHLVEKWQTQAAAFPPPSFRDWLNNALNRLMAWSF